MQDSTINLPGADKKIFRGFSLGQEVSNHVRKLIDSDPTDPASFVAVKRSSGQITLARVEHPFPTTPPGYLRVTVSLDGAWKNVPLELVWAIENNITCPVRVGAPPPADLYVAPSQQTRFLTREVILEARTAGLWVVAVVGGEIVLDMKCAGEIFRVECSLRPVEQIDYAMSYRWQGIAGGELKKGDSPVGFVHTVREVPNTFWVDYINHLDDKELIPYVIQNMGEVYCKTKVWPQYLLEIGDPPLKMNTSSDEFPLNMWQSDKVSRLSVIHGICMMRAASRGWMWQELAFSKRPDKFPSLFGMLLYYLVVLGSDMFRHTIEGLDCSLSTQDPSGSASLPTANSLKDFLFSTLRAWHDLSGVSSSRVQTEMMSFIRDEKFLPAELDSISRALEEARKTLLENPASMVRSALANMSNLNITKTEDLYHASFGVILSKVGLSRASPEEQRAWIAAAAQASSSPSFPLQYSIAQLTPCPVSNLFDDALAWAVKKSPASDHHSGQFVLFNRDGAAYLADSIPFYKSHGNFLKAERARCLQLLMFQPRIAIAAHSYTVQGAVVRLSGATLMGPMQTSFWGGAAERGQVLENLRPLSGVQLSLDALMTRPRLKSMSDIRAWTSWEGGLYLSFRRSPSSSFNPISGWSHEADLISPGFPFEMKDGEFVKINVRDHFSLATQPCHFTISASGSGFPSVSSPPPPATVPSL
jgi:hypothetical protein